MVRKKETTEGIEEGPEESAETTEENTETDEQSKPIQEETVEEHPKRRLVRRRKSKKERESPVSQALRLAVESGKVEFGSKKSVKNSLIGKTKLFVISANTPKASKDIVTRNAELSNTPILNFEGSSLELGSICGKPYPVAILSVYEVGSSNIMDLTKKK
ncbi:50S ribosomal protein L30e [Candidatus Micrarchaeota archaeon]|nr:50S ribosomal protein L30e [Candidatus Micrarchaeota archaeon]